VEELTELLNDALESLSELPAALFKIIGDVKINVNFKYNPKLAAIQHPTVALNEAPQLYTNSKYYGLIGGGQTARLSRISNPYYTSEYYYIY
jgi:hypothetical protein